MSGTQIGAAQIRCGSDTPGDAGRVDVSAVA